MRCKICNIDIENSGRISSKWYEEDICIVCGDRIDETTVEFFYYDMGSKTSDIRSDAALDKWNESEDRIGLNEELSERD